MTAANKVLEKLPDAREVGDSQWEARCPAHDDRRASLSVAEADDGTVLLKCHAGCGADQITQAVGLTLRDLFPSSNGNGKPKPQANGQTKSRLVKAYSYHDAEGNLVFQVVRFTPKDFRQRRPDGQGGWLWNLSGVNRVAYRLPELLAADASQPVFVVKGEKDCDTLAALGFVTTCNAGGAGKWADLPELKGRRVVIIPDNDPPGQRHAEDVARSARKVGAASVKILSLPGLPGKGDVSTWLIAHAPEELHKLADAAEEWQPTAETPTSEQTETEAPAPEAVALSLLASDGRTDAANAQRFVQKHGQDVRWCDPHSCWYVWSGKHWAQDRTRKAEALMSKVAADLWGEVRLLATDKSIERAVVDKAVQFVRGSNGANGIKNALALVKSAIPVVPEQFDTDHWLWNCPNGTLDLRTQELREHRREDYITKLCPTKYIPDATCPRWLDFLWMIHDGNQEVIDFDQRHSGYCLTGETREQVIRLDIGSGANGKSTALNCKLAVMGTDYAMQAPPNFLMQHKTDRHPTELYDLRGKRFVAATETGSGRSINEELVKLLTGGESVRARLCHKDNEEFKATHKLAIGTNNEPRIRGQDHAIWRRIAKVPYGVTFWNPDGAETGPPELKQDKALPEKLASEAEGILAWMVRGCLEWQRIGLAMPETVRAATDAYRSHQDIVGQFVEACCIASPEATTTFKALYEALQQWCEANGENTPSRTSVGLWLDSKGFERLETKQRRYRGIGVVLSDE